MTLHIDRQSGTAPWAQIAMHLKEQIVKGAAAPGSRLPTEHAMAQSFGVNRHTVRRALASLESAGLLQTVQGSGAYVRDHVLDYAVGPRTRFSQSLGVGDFGESPHRSRQFLDAVAKKADAKTAKALKIGTGARVISVRLLGSVDNRPISLGTHTFSADRFPDIDKDIAETLSVTESLSRQGVHDYQRQTTRITAHLPEDAEADLLELPRTRPVLQTESTNVNSAGDVIEYGVARFAADRIQLVIDS